MYVYIYLYIYIYLINILLDYKYHHILNYKYY